MTSFGNQRRQFRDGISQAEAAGRSPRDEIIQSKANSVQEWHWFDMFIIAEHN